MAKHEPILGENAGRFGVLLLVGMIAPIAFILLTQDWLPDFLGRFVCTYITATC